MRPMGNVSWAEEVVHARHSDGRMLGRMQSSKSLANVCKAVE